MKRKGFAAVAVLYVFFSVLVISAGLFLTDSLPQKLSYKINSFFAGMDIPVSNFQSGNNVEVEAPEYSQNAKKILSSDMKAAWLDLSSDIKSDIASGVSAFLTEADENISYYTNFHCDTLFIKPDTADLYASLVDVNGTQLDLLREYLRRADAKKWKKCLVADDSLIFDSNGLICFDKIGYYITNYDFDGVLLYSDLLIRSNQLYSSVEYYSPLIKEKATNLVLGVAVSSSSSAKYADEQTVNILNSKLTDFIIVMADSSVKSSSMPYASVMSWWNDFASKYPENLFYILHRTDLMRKGEGEWASYSELSEELRAIWDYDKIFGSVFYSTSSMMGKNVPFAQRAATTLENGTSEQLKITKISLAPDGKTVSFSGSSVQGHKLLCNHTLAKSNGGYFSFNYLLNPGFNSFEFSSYGAKLTYRLYNNTVPDNMYRFNVSPYTDNGLGQSVMCQVYVDDAEQIGSNDSVNVYRPDYSNLCKGTLDYVDSVNYSPEGYMEYKLRSGFSVFSTDCVLIGNAYTMPLNNIVFTGVNETASTTDIIMNTDWLVPVTVKAQPQMYSVGYQGYPFNLSSYTVEYVDVNFNNTAALYNSNLLNFGADSPFLRYELFQGDNDNLILRLHLKKKGQFYGFDIFTNESNQIVLSFKKHSDGSLAGKRIMLDPGHGGFAMTGTALRDGSVSEREVTLSIAKKLKAMLEQRGATVIMTRTLDEAYDLDERVWKMSEHNPDLFISIHCDGTESGADSGTHTFYFRSYSQPLASAIHKALVYTYQHNIYSPTDTNFSSVDRGIKYYPFYVTRINQCPSVLIETGFMSNPVEGRILTDDNCQYWIAQGINDGIVNYFKENNVLA